MNVVASTARARLATRYECGADAIAAMVRQLIGDHGLEHTGTLRSGLAPLN